MSTSYITNPDIKWVDFWNDLPPSLKEAVIPASDKDAGTTETSRCLTDGQCFFWCYTGNPVDGTVSFERFGLQHTVDDIIAAIEEHYGVELIDEHDDRYWEDDDEEDEEDEEDE